MIKIFTSLKGGDGRVAEIQRRALDNWRRIFPAVEIVDVGEERRLDKMVGELAQNEIGAWVNADIIFGKFPIWEIIEGRQLAGKWLVIGQRTDCLLDGSKRLHRPSGMDYFFFNKAALIGIKPVIMGRGYCDSAIVQHALKNKVRIIDATAEVVAYHQWHDYGHHTKGVAGVMVGEEAMENKRIHELLDFPVNIVDATHAFERDINGKLKIVGNPRRSLFRHRHPRLWNILTRGGLYWGSHISGAITWTTRSDLSWWSVNSNNRYRPHKLAKEYPLELVTIRHNQFDKSYNFDDIAAHQVIVANKFIYPLMVIRSVLRTHHLATGFNFPELIIGWVAKLLGCRWDSYLWDPPALSHRDKKIVKKDGRVEWKISLTGKIVDIIWRILIRPCDKLILTIHPGILDEIGYSPRKNQVEYHFQDAFEEMSLEREIGDNNEVKYDFGVLSNWSEAKGGVLFAKALAKIGNKTAIWIGEAPTETATINANLSFTGHLSQSEAFAKLKSCRVLVAPYLPVPSLKWNYVLKLFEYLQLGRPILASDNPGNVAIAEKFPKRITLFKSGDVEDLVAKMKEMMK